MKHKVTSLPNNKQNDCLKNNLITIKQTEKTFSDLVINSRHLDMLKEFIKEQHSNELLKSYALEPKHKILLTGHTGNGKTCLAEAIATELMYPLYLIKYENVIGNSHKETILHLDSIVDYTKLKNVVLVFDEFDSLTDEMQNDMILQIDTMPSNMVVIVATKYAPEFNASLLRRFQLLITLDNPDKIEIEFLIKAILNWSNIKINNETIVMLGNKLFGLSYSDISAYCIDVIRYCRCHNKILNLQDLIISRLNSIQYLCLSGRYKNTVNKTFQFAYQNNYEKLNIEELMKWKRNGFDSQTAQGWNNAGFTLPEAKKAVNLGFYDPSKWATKKKIESGNEK